MVYGRMIKRDDLLEDILQRMEQCRRCTTDGILNGGRKEQY
jgi:hypothetical protein